MEDSGDSEARTQDSCAHWAPTANKRRQCILYLIDIVSDSLSVQRVWPPFIPPLSGLLKRRIQDPKCYSPIFLTASSATVPHTTWVLATTWFSLDFPDYFLHVFSSPYLLLSWFYCFLSLVAEVTFTQKHIFKFSLMLFQTFLFTEPPCTLHFSPGAHGNWIVNSSRGRHHLLSTRNCA